jgi:hypothetical protein
MTQVNKVNEIVDVLNESLNFYYTEENPALTPENGDCTWTVTHNLGTTNVTYSIYQDSVPIMAEVQVLSANTLTVKINSLLPVSEGTYKIVVMGGGSTEGDPGSVEVEPINVIPSKIAQTIVAPVGTLGYNPVNVSAVTASIDSNIKAENIKKDVNILGVTGTLESATDPVRYYRVVVIDYDGTILKEDLLTTGETFTLPETNPSHERLIFQEWSSPVEIVNNTVTVGNSDIVIGAVYTTASGLTEVDIELNDTTGLSITFNMNGTKDWGDGTVDTTKTHTYAEIGNYTITCDGTAFTEYYGFENTNYTVKNIHFANIGTLKDYCCNNLKALSTVTIPKDTTINECFNGCSSLKAIVIPSSVASSIKNFCFLNCSSLEYAVIPYGVTSIGARQTFMNCYSLRNLTIPRTAIFVSPSGSSSDGMFWNCRSLESLTIPSTVAVVPSYALKYCYSLKYLEVEKGVQLNEYVCDRCHALEYANILIDGSIPNNAFEGCISLRKVKLSEGLTSIGNYAFLGCTSLEGMSLPSTITGIGENAFEGCSSFYYINFPEGLTSIGGWSFKGCKLNSVNLPSTLTASIQDRTFSDCRSLVDVVLNNNTSINGRAFEGCYAIKNLELAEGLTDIGDSAFSDSYALQKITLPTTLQSIGYSAFQNCYAIEELDFTETSLTSIGAAAFQNCYSLEKVKFPSTITSIGGSAFQNCTSCVEYDFTECTSIPTLGYQNVFEHNLPLYKIKVPASLYEDWKAADKWSDSRIVNHIVAA